MNKIAIPVLLVATIMVAGAFAFVPVEQASTVHLSDAGQGTTLTTGTGDQVNDVITMTCGNDSACTISAIIITDTGTAAVQTEELVLTHDGVTGNLIVDVGIDALANTISVEVIFALGQGSITIGAGDILALHTGNVIDFTVDVFSTGEISISVAP